MAPSGPQPPEHEIDLHGMKVEQALRHLERALASLRVARVRRVRVITGRGWGSPGGKSRLKPAVREWLVGPEGRRLGVRELSEAARGGAWDLMVDPPA